jgi:hypothetical protein
MLLSFLGYKELICVGWLWGNCLFWGPSSESPCPAEATRYGVGARPMVWDVYEQIEKCLFRLIVR